MIRARDRLRSAFAAPEVPRPERGSEGNPHGFGVPGSRCGRTQRSQPERGPPALTATPSTGSGPGSDFTRALGHLEQGIALHRLDEHRDLAHQRAGYDPCVACRIFSAYALWYLGYPDRAARRIAEGIALARELAQTFSLSLAMQFATMIHHLRRETPEAKAAAATNIGLSTEQANVFMLGCSMVEEGWAMAHEGQHARGLARISQCFRQALEIARQQSARSLELRAATSLGRLLQQQGKRDEVRRHVEEVYGWFTEGFDTRI